MGIMIVVGVVVLGACIFFCIKFGEPHESSIHVLGTILITVFCVFMTAAIFTRIKFEKQKYLKSDTIIEVFSVNNDLVFENENKYESIFDFDFDNKETGDKLSVRKIVRASNGTFFRLSTEATKYVLIVPKGFADKLSK